MWEQSPLTLIHKSLEKLQTIIAVSIFIIILE
jgi:hypothetical protein